MKHTDLLLLIILLIPYCSSLLCSGVNCDDNNDCTVDSCILNICSHTPAIVGTACNDGLFCTTGDKCNALGTCIGSQPTCGNTLCNSYCNETAQNCFNPVGTSCDDGLWCNGEDYCNGAGNCIHQGNPCATSTAACTTTICDETRHCLLPAGSPCTNDGNQCTQDVCNNQGSCLHSFMNGTTCNDGNWCTLNDKCSGYQCSGSWNPQCCASNSECDDNNICTYDTCINGTCTHSPHDGISCSDGNWCNGEEMCHGGVCQAGTAPCGTSDPCNNHCNNATRTCFSAINTPCDDNLFCNGADFCNGAGSCVGSGVSPCGGLCTGHCDEATDLCADPVDTPCDDGIFCNGVDSCDGSGHCIPSQVDPCSDLTCQNRCDEDLEMCTPSFNGTECEGNFCEGASFTCQSGECVAQFERCNETHPICDAENQVCLASNTTEPNNTTTTTTTTTTGNPDQVPSSSPATFAKAQSDSNFLVIGATSGGGAVLVGGVCVALCVVKRKRKEEKPGDSKASASSLSSREEKNYTNGFYVDSSGASSMQVDSRMYQRQDNQWNIHLGGIIILSHVGSGNFGEVYKGLLQANKNSPMQEVALKSLKNEDSFTDFLEEASLLSHLDHPNVVKFYGVFVQEEKYIVTEFVNRGSLLDLLHCTTFPQYPNKEIALGAAKGMAYLHSKSVIHRDLACRNLLVNFSHGSYTVKISDFGMARAIERYYYSNSNQIPIRWSAPEALCYKKYSQPSDVWSFGIVLWEIYSRGAEPYAGYTNPQVVDLVLEGHRLEKPEGCPDDMYSIMHMCWQEDKYQRPTFDDLVVLIARANVNKTSGPAIKAPEKTVVESHYSDMPLKLHTEVAVFEVDEEDESVPPSYGADNHA